MNILKLEHCEGYLLAEVGGPFNLSAAKEIAAIIVDERVKGGHGKLFIDARKIEGDISIVDRYEYGKFIGGFRDPAIKTVVVARQEIILPDKFMENVIANVGGNVMVTTDSDKALQWLGVNAEGSLS